MCGLRIDNYVQEYKLFPKIHIGVRNFLATSIYSPVTTRTTSVFKVKIWTNSIQCKIDVRYFRLGHYK